MKLQNLTLALATEILSLNAHTTNYKFMVTDNSFEARICMLTASNKRLELKNALQLYAWGNKVVTEQFAVNNITCNGMVMAHFAHKYDAPNTFEYLNRLTIRKNKIK